MDRLPEDTPRLPTRTRHDRHFRELAFRSLRLIATSERLYLPNDFAPLFKARFQETVEAHGRQQRVRRDEHVTTRRERAKRAVRDSGEEAVKFGYVACGQHREPWQRRALRSVVRWRDAPYAAVTVL